VCPLLLVNPALQRNSKRHRSEAGRRSLA